MPILKITTDTDAGRTILKLEGRLTGPRVEELKTCWQKAGADKKQVGVVLNEVIFIDDAGRKLLADMHRQGVGLTAAARRCC